jgi:GntR family transcriptional regulator, transcriptional repressor for pyruvate dehydrogenase complex
VEKRSVTTNAHADRPTLPRSDSRGAKASDVIARDLLRYILENDLPEGSMLPVERDMIAMLGVARVSLREALRLLETRGILEIRKGPRGGPVVRRPDATHLTEALTLILQFEGATMATVFTARLALEPTLARLAAKRITQGQLAELDDSIATSLASLDDHALFIGQDARFHSVVAEAAGPDAVVLRVFRDQLDALRHGREMPDPGYPRRRLKRFLDMHAQIAAALRAKDAAGAGEWMQTHVEDLAAYWKSKHPDLYRRPIHWAG